MAGENRELTRKEQNKLFLRVCWSIFKKNFNWHHIAFLLMIYGFGINFIVGAVFLELEGRLLVDYSLSDIHFHLHRLQNPNEIITKATEDYYPPLFHGIIGYLLYFNPGGILKALTFIIPLLHWIILPTSIYYLSREFWQSKKYGGLAVVLYLLGTSFTNFSTFTATWPHALSMALLMLGLREQIKYLRKKDTKTIVKAFGYGIIITLTHGVTCIIYWLLITVTTLLTKEYHKTMLVFLISTGVMFSTLGHRFKNYLTRIGENTDDIAPSPIFLLTWANPMIIYWAYKEIRTWSPRPDQLLILAATILPALTFLIDPAYRPIHMFGMMCAILSPRAAENTFRNHFYLVCGWGFIFLWFHQLVYIGNVLQLAGVFQAYGIGDPLVLP